MLPFFRPLKMKWREALRTWKNKYSGVLPKTHFPGVLKQTINDLKKENIETNLKSGFKACGIYPLDKNQVIKRLHSTSTSIDDVSWINEFESILSKRRSHGGIVQGKRKRLNVAPGKSISTFENSEDTDDQDNQDDPDSKNDPDDPDPIQPNTYDPIIVPVPSCSSAPESMTEVQKMSVIDMESDDEDNFTSILKVNDYILVKCLYGEGTKKNAYKMFPSLIEAITKSIKGTVFTCLFLRSYKGS